mgnify:CR=1 FL=1
MWDMGLGWALRLGISFALADYQPLRITRCAQTDVQRLKRRKTNPPSLANHPNPTPHILAVYSRRLIKEDKTEVY